MNEIALYGIIVAFGLLVCVNVYFRLRVIGAYRRLTRTGLPFGLQATHIFDTQKLENEIIIKYPAYAQDLRKFTQNIRYSVYMASALIATILLFAFILLKTNH